MGTRPREFGVSQSWKDLYQEHVLYFQAGMEAKEMENQKNECLTFKYPTLVAVRRLYVDNLKGNHVGSWASTVYFAGQTLVQLKVV